MANHPKLIVIPGTFHDAVERLLHTAPPPTKTAAAREALAKQDVQRKRKTQTGAKKKTGTRKKAR
jgi:hypothetical protein